jgi:predicted dehydrogenase
MARRLFSQAAGLALMPRALEVAAWSATCFVVIACGRESRAPAESAVGAAAATFMTLDPGHFHAALVQKSMYDAVSPQVYVFAPAGPDVELHLARIDAFNARPDSPTSWQQHVYTGPDFVERMLEERPGNIVVISGNNALKARYIRDSVAASLHVLADKPMAITPGDFPVLQAAFRLASHNGVLLYDIMTERYEITAILQRELSQVAPVFGELVPGTVDDPAVTQSSVHHFFKHVAGRPLQRPAWFFDVTQEGEGIVDVTTHLIDLVHWQCFPDTPIDHRKDVEVLAARRWPTSLTLEQFRDVTGHEAFPDALTPIVTSEGILPVYANGEISYRVRGVHAKVAVEWRYRAPEGTGDTHYSVMRGTRAKLVVRDHEGAPGLYVEPSKNSDDFEKALRGAVAVLGQQYPGISIEAADTAFEIVIPDALRVGHEAHFAQVTERYFEYLAQGRIPEIEITNMLAKYFITTRAYELSR